MDLKIVKNILIIIVGIISIVIFIYLLNVWWDNDTLTAMQLAKEYSPYVITYFVCDILIKIIGKA